MQNCLTDKHLKGAERFLAWLTTGSIVLQLFALDREFCRNQRLEEKSDSLTLVETSRLFHNTLELNDAT